MLELVEINRVVKDAAAASLKSVNVARVFSAPTTDSQGEEALHVTVVLEKFRDGEIDGDSVVNALVKIDRDLRKSGEERSQIIDFATEEELESGGDTES